MKARPTKNIGGHFVSCPAKEATHLIIHLPGPSGVMIIPIGTKPGWTWNTDTEKPTLRPSLLSSMGRDGSVICHSWVTDGKASFLPDCSHSLKGKTCDLIDVADTGPGLNQDQNSSTVE